MTIHDVFVLRDYANGAVTGKVFADFATCEAYQISDPTITAPVTLTEIGNGEYRVAFQPTQPESGEDEWACHVVYSSSGLFREFSGNYTVRAPS
jgi:hypothetical protein